ncbi:hypothetical protein HJG60_010107 [Phyllostomus discolor]|uniref:Secreted protein n=1 Tax=Phyllostomus discolor TaxID=89673 RepID=A0A834EG43_9CHIR|nr:hypothetical protein HJG60_010107 [Phyllostomus discolor]
MGMAQLAASAGHAAPLLPTLPLLLLPLPVHKCMTLAIPKTCVRVCASLLSHKLPKFHPKYYRASDPWSPSVDVRFRPLILDHVSHARPRGYSLRHFSQKGGDRGEELSLMSQFLCFSRINQPHGFTYRAFVKA